MGGASEAAATRFLYVHTKARGCRSGADGAVISLSPSRIAAAIVAPGSFSQGGRWEPASLYRRGSCKSTLDLLCRPQDRAFVDELQMSRAAFITTSRRACGRKPP